MQGMVHIIVSTCQCGFKMCGVHDLHSNIDKEKSKLIDCLLLEVSLDVL